MYMSPLTSPATNLVGGCVLVLPPTIVAAPSVLRWPLAEARMPYLPAGAVKLKVPSALAVTEVTNESSRLYSSSVTGLPANTCPVRVPVVGMGVAVGVGEPPGVGELIGGSCGVIVDVITIHR